MMARGRRQTVITDEETLPDALEISTLPPERRRDYARFVVEELLNRNPSGITPDDIARIAGLSKKTVYHHLEVLTAMRRALRKEWSPRRRVYFPVVDTMASLADDVLDLAKRQYAFRKAGRDEEVLIQVQEREAGPDGIQRVKGGILIPVGDVEPFVRRLRQFSEEAMS